MSFEIYVSENFRKQAKRLIRKYPSLKKELSVLYDNLVMKHDLGTPLGKNCFKIRIAVKSKGRGKSGGLRVITWLIYRTGKINNKNTHINMVSIYDKSEYENVSDTKLQELLNQIFDELKL
jgi:hypothetical protein